MRFRSPLFSRKAMNSRRSRYGIRSWWPQVCFRPEASTPTSGISHLAEAVAAIYRAIAAGTERNGCVGSAIAADDGEAFALASAESAAASTAAAKVVTRLASPSVPARNTPFRIVGEASRGVKFLLAYGEEKLCSTVAAFKGHVGKGHGSSSGLVGNHGAHARSVSSGTAITIPKDRGPAQFCCHYYTCIVDGKQRFSPPESENHGFRRRLRRRTPSGFRITGPGHTGSATKTGIFREVRPWYSSYGGNASTEAAQSRARSSGSDTSRTRML